MARGISPEEAARRWVHNSIEANPDRIKGIVRAYFQGKKSIKWVTGLLKNEDQGMVLPIVAAFKMIDPIKYETLLQGLPQVR